MSANVGVGMRLLGLAVRLIDWVWWGASGRAGLAGVGWHLKRWVRVSSWPVRNGGSRLREVVQTPGPVVVAVIACCVVFWVGVALGAWELLELVDLD